MIGSPEDQVVSRLPTDGLRVRTVSMSGYDEQLPVDRPRVLLVEDHPELGLSIRQGLIREGFEVVLATTLQNAVAQMAREPRPHLIVLDLSLPDADGLEAVRALRALPVPNPLPILVLTVYRDLDLRVRALEAGADDFMAKPFAMAELAARLRALSRRGRADRWAPRRWGPLWLDPRDRAVQLGEAVAHLTPGEFTLLSRLTAPPQRPRSAAELGDPQPGDPIAFSEGAVRVLVHRLRGKLRQAFGDRVRVRWNRLEGYWLEVRE